MIVELVRIVVSIVVLLGVAFGISSIPTIERTSNDPFRDFEELTLELPAPTGTDSQPETNQSKTGAPNNENEPEQSTESEDPVSIIESDPSVTLPDPGTILPTPKLQDNPVSLTFADINDSTREALVNILCIAQNHAAAGSITGSGIFISDKGVILTNAHIAQFFLLKDYPVEDSIDCTIRTGSPATNTYRAELLFLHPQWVAENASVIANEEPLGTGEFDYALLYVTESTDPHDSLPESYPSLDITTREAIESEQVLLASYPAGFLGSELIQKNLYAASSVSEVGKLFTLATTSIDVYSVGGTVVAQQGSSGGAVVDGQQGLLGLIVTSTLDGNTSERDLRALATSYINRSFVEFNGVSLNTFLNSDLDILTQQFNALFSPALRSLLVQKLEE